MNKNILNAFIAGSLVMGLAGCSENSWNDHFLDGFEEGVDYSGNTVDGTYTLTAEDYATISDLMLAKATTDEEKAAAKAIGSNLYFDKTSVYGAPVAVPAFIDTPTFPYYYAANGSTVDVTYSEAASVPAELGAIAAAETYTVSKNDYQEAWDSESDFISAFAPANKPESTIPALLTSEFPDAAEGTYAVVTYNEASENPIFGTIGGGGDEPAWEPTSVISGVALDNEVKIKGWVTAIDNRGFVLTDASGSILCYQASGFNVDDVAIGDRVSLSGTVGAYNKGFQIAITSENYTVDDPSEYKYPTPVHYTGAMMDEAVTRTDNELAKFVTITGTASVSGNYYNFTVEGAETAIGSGYMVPKSVSDLITDGEDYMVSGYFITVSNGKYFNIVITGVSPTKNAAKSQSFRAPVVEVPSVTKNAVYYRGSKTWAVAEGVVALNPADYAALGFSNNKLSDPEVYIPMYLKINRPYAQNGDMQYVVYNGTKVALFVFDGTAWSLNNNGLETVTGRYTKKDNAWSFVKYIGKAEFVEFTEQQIMVDRSYLIVSGGICAVPVDKNNNYGYLYTSNVTISGGKIIQPTDVNAFAFVSSCEIDGNEVKAPEGQFMLRDSNGRYMYMTGTYSSANLTALPVVDGGVISAQYLWKAVSNGDGTWSISNVGNDRVMAYSSKYSSFGVYEKPGADDAYPSLYILSE